MTPCISLVYFVNRCLYRNLYRKVLFYKGFIHIKAFVCEIIAWTFIPDPYRPGLHPALQVCSPCRALGIHMRTLQISPLFSLGIHMRIPHVVQVYTSISQMLLPQKIDRSPICINLMKRIIFNSISTILTRIIIESPLLINILIQFRSKELHCCVLLVRFHSNPASSLHIILFWLGLLRRNLSCKIKILRNYFILSLR